MMVTRTIEHRRGQTFTLSSWHCRYCGGKGFYERECYDEQDEFAYCPHCKANEIYELHNPDATLPLLNAGIVESIVDKRTWTEEVTRTAEDWAITDQLNESMRRFSRMLSQDLFGDGNVPAGRLYGLQDLANETKE